MRPRQGLLELFSTFLQFEGDRYSGWATDLRLRRHMSQSLTQLTTHQRQQPAPQPDLSQTDLSEQFWAIYWHKSWQTQPDPLVQGHLVAYLQEVCYWAAQKTIVTFGITQYTLSDCFQAAIARIDKVLRGFDSNHGTELKTYASVSLNILIREFLRQRQVVDICSDWALLRKVSQKRFIAALQQTTLSPDLVKAYVLTWRCLKNVQVPTQGKNHKLPKPDDAVWQKVAQLYNADRQSIGASAGHPATLEKWMQASVKAIRAYLYPTLTSMNAPIAGQDSGELMDRLPSDEGESLLSNLIATEEQDTRSGQQAQLNQILSAALATLDAQVQQLLALYYAQGLTQQEIAKQLDMKQYTISRRFSKAREVLLLALAKWSQDTLHIEPTTDVLKGIGALLEEWLANHYRPNRLTAQS